MIDNLQTPLYRTNQIRSRSTLLYKPYIFIFLICPINSNRCSKKPYLLIFWHLGVPDFLLTFSFWDNFLNIEYKTDSLTAAVCQYCVSKSPSRCIKRNDAIKINKRIGAISRTHPYLILKYYFEIWEAIKNKRQLNSCLFIFLTSS